MAKLPLKAARLSFRHDRGEDRLNVLAASAGNEAIVLQLTRRLTGLAINAIAGVLEKTNRVARQAPNEMRDDIVLLEHLGALQASALASTEAAAVGDEGGKTAVKSPALMAPPQLVHRIELTTRPNEFAVIFKGSNQPLVALTLGRTGLHRVLETLQRSADAAEWAIRVNAAWLKPEDSEIVLN